LHPEKLQENPLLVMNNYFNKNTYKDFVQMVMHVKMIST